MKIHNLIFHRILATLCIKTTGYRPKSIPMEIILGSILSVSYILWGYTFAALIFKGEIASYLPLAVAIVLISTAVISVIVALTSAFPANVAGLEEQAVAILAALSLLINVHIVEFSGNDAAAATMFVIMALTTILLGLCFHLAARFNLSPLIQMMPFPVVCGFLAGIGWLFFSAGITMVTDSNVEVLRLAPLFTMDKLIHWVPALVCGLAVYVLIKVKNHFLILPSSLIACAVGFYAFAWWQGISMEALRDGGWMFQLDIASSNKGLTSLDFSNVNFKFIFSVLPEIGIIALISILSTLFSFSALELGTGTYLDLNAELRVLGNANILSGIGLGLPGSIDVATSMIFSSVGGSSRLLAIICGLGCLFAAIFGSDFIERIPKIVMGALVFIYAIKLIHEWLLMACKQMPLQDIISVWLIFGAIVLIGFIPGILVGIILTSLLFIIRISKIDVVGSSFSLNQLSSSVERSSTETSLLQKYGKEVKIFNLRGFLFFGSTNTFFDRINAVCKQDTTSSYFIFNFRRVIGIDSTATQVFLRLNNLLESKKIIPVYCGLNEHVLPIFSVTKIFELSNPLVLNDLDLAMKWVEERLIANRCKHDTKNIVTILNDILGDYKKAEQLVGGMERISLASGEYLFRQDDVESTIYIIESGSVEVQLECSSGQKMRLREFRQGSMIGEMVLYSATKKRSASAVVADAAVVYRLDPVNLQTVGKHDFESEAILHETVARLLASRLNFMNQRIEADL